MPKAIPIEEEIGKRYGRLVVIAFHGYKKPSNGLGNYKLYKFQCDCGSICVRNIAEVRYLSPVTSCGCVSRIKTIQRNFKHGLTIGKNILPEYRSWSMMKDRCFNSNNKLWHRYGGRGITVAPEWRYNFTAFMAYVGNRPSANHSIDRINNDGNYTPGNVKWSTKIEQGMNTSTVKNVTYKGEVKTLATWCRLLNLHYSRTQSRLARGWSAEDAFELPKGERA